MPEIRPLDSRLLQPLDATKVALGWRARLEGMLSSSWAIRLLIPGLVALAGIAILVIGDNILRRSLESMGRARFTDQSSHLAEHLLQSMRRAEARHAALAGAVRELGPDMPDVVLARTMQLAFDGNPVIAWMSVATPDGRFRGLQRDGLRLIFVSSTPGPQPGQAGSEVRRTLTPEGNFTALDVRATTYDPRTRPYYITALAAGTTAWTDPYTFFPDYNTGITISAPLFAADHRLQAVTSVDCDAHSIGATLAQFSSIPGSRCLVFASDGTVLGTTGTPAPSKSGNRVTNLLDLQDPVLLALAQEVKANGLPESGTLPSGNGIIAAVRSLIPVPGTRWYIISYTNEDEILGPAHELRTQGLLIDLAAITAATLVGLLLANAMARARRERSEAREQVRQAHDEARQLGAYRLLNKLGEGGMGEVWRAEHRQLARPAAIKLMRKLGVEPEFTARFEREAKVIASLTCRNTINIYDYGVAEDGALYYVMELLDGLDLEMLVLKHGPIPPSRVISILRQICLSLAEAHDRGLVHRDIKPANIYLCRLADEVDVVKVLDFGLVLSLKRGDAAANRLSVPGTVSGSPICMAPEQARGLELDGRTDLYAVGCVAWWLIQGRMPFNAVDPMAMMLAHVNDALPDLPALVPNAPTDLVHLIRRLLAKDPADRPADAREVSHLLRQMSQQPDPGYDKPWDEDIATTWWLRHQPMPPNSALS